MSLLRQLGGPVVAVAASRSAGESLDTLLLTLRLGRGLVALHHNKALRR